MAKNWTVAEVAKVIVNNGVINEDAMDFGKRFPITTNLITAALAGSKDALITLLDMLPDYVTMGKMEKNFKEAAGTTDGVEAQEDDADTTEETEATESGEKDYSEMNNKELKAALRQAGFKSSEIKGKNKAAMLEMLKAGANTADAADDEVEEEAEAEDATEEAVDYSKMTAKDLYKLCKSKGIDVEQKKPAKYYIDALTAEEAETEDDEWEEEAPAAKPAKSTKTTKSSKSSKNSKSTSKKSEKSTAKAEPKAKPAAKAEEDEWDI